MMSNTELVVTIATALVPVAIRLVPKYTYAGKAFLKLLPDAIGFVKVCIEAFKGVDKPGETIKIAVEDIISIEDAK